MTQSSVTRDQGMQLKMHKIAWCVHTAFCFFSAHANNPRQAGAVSPSNHTRLVAWWAEARDAHGSATRVPATGARSPPRRSSASAGAPEEVADLHRCEPSASNPENESAHAHPHQSRPLSRRTFTKVSAPAACLDSGSKVE